MPENRYDHTIIEAYWQSVWEKEQAFRVETHGAKKKYYCLIEFPYPSGEGLHVGHVRSYTALDVIARKRRMEGFDVLYPIGWDAFGLPAENYAIKTNIHPSITTKKNIGNYRRQLKALGFSFDWSREINTTDPTYYRWTQWIFLQLFKRGLAYKATMPVNWCLSCKTGLANEEVLDGNCERCGGSTEKRKREQWMLAITTYADRLLDDLSLLDTDERIKTQQRNWIGKSTGALIEFTLTGTDKKIAVFTTRPDTLFGATYLVLAPEHPLLQEIKKMIHNWKHVEAYAAQAKQKRDIERTAADKEKTGVALEGITAINPANNTAIPIFVADYCLPHYGTGAIMAVPAHDKRDFAFAKKHNLPIVIVICPHYPKLTCPILEDAYEGEGHLVASGTFTGQRNTEAGEEIMRAVGGKTTTTYKLRDWVFSRQRYWGEPIPIIHCPSCGAVPVPEHDLPVLLPHMDNFKPSGEGRSPLAQIETFVKTTCPVCLGPAERETDTMPNWAGSSWYFLRYIDPSNTTALADRKALDRWIPVDWYNGGMEHTTLHLLYSRFWHKFLFDEGVVPSKEPYAKRTSHGLILASGGEKMSKSKGNVINPDDIVERFGADTLRLYELFMGPFEQAIGWSTDNLIGCRRFLERVWRLAARIEAQEHTADAALELAVHQCIEKVGEDIEHLRFNTAISALMVLTHTFESRNTIPSDAFETFLLLLAPFAPHLAAELWKKSGETTPIHAATWPAYDKAKALAKRGTIVIQINGKTRGTITILRGTPEKTVREEAATNPAAKRFLEGKTIKKAIFIKDKLINFVLEP